MEDYIEMVPGGPGGDIGGTIGKNFEIMVQAKLQEMRDSPEQFFNFGFTYNDFKAYLFKITYCRAVRRFIESKRLQRITEFQ